MQLGGSSIYGQTGSTLFIDNEQSPKTRQNRGLSLKQKLFKPMTAQSMNTGMRTQRNTSQKQIKNFSPPKKNLIYAKGNQYMTQKFANITRVHSNLETNS